MRYQTWFLGNKVSVHLHRDTDVGLNNGTHARVLIQITHSIRPTLDFMPRAFPSQPVKFSLIFAIECLQCRDTKMSKSAEVLIQSS